MTNRVTEKTHGTKKLINCFDKFEGENISKVKRNGMTLSVVRKINYDSFYNLLIIGRLIGKIDYIEFF